MPHWNFPIGGTVLLLGKLEAKTTCGLRKDQSLQCTTCHNATNSPAEFCSFMSSKAGASAAVHLHHKLQWLQWKKTIAVIDLQLESFTVQKAGDQKSHFGWPQIPPSHRLALTPRYRYCVYQWLGAVKDSLLWALHINWLCECCCTFGWRACSQSTILQ